ncbi:hypothetical protein ABZ924_19345 [Streptomyces sp. NPDC046876]|uniref:hypothetical protein n=1 Tax=Streptomyces sp. NPDC046876 TaxID=3155616 RepID=UPI0033CD0E76
MPLPRDVGRAAERRLLGRELPHRTQEPVPGGPGVGVCGDERTVDEVALIAPQAGAAGAEGLPDASASYGPAR